MSFTDATLLMTFSEKIAVCYQNIRKIKTHHEGNIQSSFSVKSDGVFSSLVSNEIKNLAQFCTQTKERVIRSLPEFVNCSSDKRNGYRSVHISNFCGIFTTTNCKNKRINFLISLSRIVKIKELQQRFSRNSILGNLTNIY